MPRFFRPFPSPSLQPSSSCPICIHPSVHPLPNLNQDAPPPFPQPSNNYAPSVLALSCLPTICPYIHYPTTKQKADAYPPTTAGRSRHRRALCGVQKCRARGGASVLDNLGAICAQLPTGAGGSPFALRFRSQRAEQRALAPPTDGIPPLDNLNANSTTIQPLSNPAPTIGNLNPPTTDLQPPRNREPITTTPQSFPNHVPAARSRQTDDPALGKHPRLNHLSCRIQETHDSDTTILHHCFANPNRPSTTTQLQHTSEMSSRPRFKV